jgi:hypothetical protein
MSIQDVTAIVSAAATVIGVGLGGAALWTWRLQVRGASRHDAAKRVLSTMHTLDETITEARHQLVIFKAIRDGRTLGPPPNLDPYKEARRVAAPVWGAVKQLQSAEHDAFGPLGPQAEKRLKPVYGVTDMFMRQFHVEWSPESAKERREHLEAVVKWNMRPVALYDDEDNDEYGRLLEKTLSEAENWFRTKL